MFNSSANSFLFDLVKGKSTYIIAAFIFSFASAVFSVFRTILLIPILLIIFDSNTDIISANVSAFTKYIFGIEHAVAQDNKLVIFALLAVLTTIVSILSNYGSSIVNIKQTKYLTSEMKRRGFNLLCKVDLNYYDQNKIGDILFKVNREIDKSAVAIKSGQEILITSITILIFTLVLILISLPLSLIAIALIGLFAIANNLAIARIKKQELLLGKKSQVYNHQTIEFLTGIKHIKNTANEKQEYQGIIKSIQDKNKAEFDTQAISALLSPINEIAKTAIILVITASSYYLYARQIQIFVPILIVYLLILFQLLPQLDRLNNIRSRLANHKSSVEVVANFISKVGKPIMKSGNNIFTNLQTKIEFKNVTFAYPNQAQIVLDKINLNINKGETIALIGAAGAGKSSLVSLLPRLYEPIEGKIIIDGKDVTEYSLSSLRKSIITITQEPFIFNKSILENLTYGLENIDESDVMDAAKKNKADDFINQLSQGLKTKVGDRENDLSEVQKQLISITRALLCNPAIVILDEPLATLGKLEQKTVQNALNQLCRDRTTIVITNQLATIKKADRIIVLNKGKIIESGTHQDLLKNGNLYKRMCSAQFKTSQQSHQQLLAKKISKKLARQANSNLSYEIRNNLNSLLNYLQLVNEGLIKDDQEQERILDESYQSAKNMLASLREYERKISQGFKKGN